MNDYGIPYEIENIYNSRFSPSTLHAHNTMLARYFARGLLQKAFSVFEWTIPKNWSLDYLKYVLYLKGYIAFIKTSKYGVIPQSCELSGYDIFYRPNVISIHSPLLPYKQYHVENDEAVLLKLTPDYNGITDIISYYADCLAITSETLSLNLFNSQLSFTFTADNKTSAESFKKMFDDLHSGNPAVVVDKQLLGVDGNPKWFPFSQNVGQNYIADKLIADMNNIMAAFDSEIGIRNANTDKKERLIKAEVESNTQDTLSKSDTWLECLQEGIYNVNRIFNVNIEVKRRWSHEKNDDINLGIV